MCGIAGILQNNNATVSEQHLKQMTDIIAHRGPDGEGQWTNSAKKIGLGHRRLSIIDLSDNAKQPMHYAEGRYTLTFNGEIYNYIEIKEFLVKKGYQFRSDSDTEVLLALYDLKKEKCLEDLDGMFAFALWDEKNKTLFCARDRFGEKPFYYHYIPGKKIVFASEMKAIWAAGVPKEINHKMMVNFFSNTSALSNPANKSETFYDQVSKLEAAHYIILDENLNLIKKRYWDIDLKIENKTISEEEAIKKFKDLFELSTKLRLRSDVPIGSSLSGGLDSSTIVCLIDKINTDSKIVQKTFSARFKDFAKDEGKFMEMVISKTKVQPHYTWPDENTLINDFDKMFYHQEEPFGTASIFAQWSVMKLAKENNVTVLMDGQGADEILAGYPYYLRSYLHDLFKTNTTLYRKELGAYQNMHDPSFMGNSGSSPLMQQVKNIVRPIYKAISSTKKAIPDLNFLDASYLSQFNSNDYYDTAFDGNLKGQLYRSACTTGLEDLLRFADRNSMAHSREVRLPFLSHKLVEFVFSLPSHYKINEGWTKYILRRSFEDILPKEIAWRTDKIGYEPPQQKWMQNPAIVAWVNDAKQTLESTHILNKKRDSSKDDNWKILIANKMLQ